MTRIFTEVEQCVIAGFRREVDQKCAALGYQTASTATFRDKLSVQSSKVKTQKKNINNFDVFLTLHQSIDFSNYQLRAQFF